MLAVFLLTYILDGVNTLHEDCIYWSPIISRILLSIFMILTKLKLDAEGKPLKWQKTEVECDKCKEVQQGTFYELIIRKKIDTKPHICRSCNSKYPARVEYIGPEIISNLKRNKKGLFVSSQLIDVLCYLCSNTSSLTYCNHKANMIKKLSIDSDHKYKCITCIHSITFTKMNTASKGKTYEELYSLETANTKKFNLRLLNLRTSKVDNLRKHCAARLGKSNIEYYGIKKAKEISQKLSSSQKIAPRKKRYGKDNPQFGKPPSEFSGRGWKGHYKGNFFRSLLELSFIVNFLEAKHIVWESGELHKHLIPYISIDGRQRNYFPDFITKNNIIEIKPSRLTTHGNNINKMNAAIEHAKENNKTYKMYTEKDFNSLTKTQVWELEQTGNLVFTSKGGKKV